MSFRSTLNSEEAADRMAIRDLVDAYAYCADRRDATGKISFQFRAGPYRIVRDSSLYFILGEYLVTVQASGLVDALNRRSNMEVRT